MGDVLLMAQPWIKAFHILAVISWMAAMLYLPRLFVNHAGLETGSEASELLKGMEDRLYRLIMNPAMLAALAAGVVLAILGGQAIWGSLWFWGKVVFLGVLMGFHGYCTRWLKAFARDENQHSARFYRFMNEVPTLAMIVIVALAVVRPF